MTGFVDVLIPADGGLPATVALPAPDGDLRVVLVAVAADLALLRALPEDQWVIAAETSAAAATGTVAVPGLPDPFGVPVGLLSGVRIAALTAFTAPPGATLSDAEVRVTALVVTGRRVLAIVPAGVRRPVAVRDGDRMRGRLQLTGLQVSAGALIGPSPGGVRASIGWRTVTQGGD